ncbi:DUF6089 family protein [Flavobacterium sp. GT3R68]|uniref:type IX secretion system protein PorG n=1 Tax=Flavobacterium sp. GT3R68 TaxID=2594437 RepID=UPI000F891BCC|nr:DUF6089 family protein [Flavobacterium sp. GT3R68]RTY87007.1 hypothetical protein EKL32_27010 [Flavobacterium sp. GSN2]TRW90396.1 hypothetical protein FNW07_10180 [Flavobacterium sp. GT3R68]
MNRIFVLYFCLFGLTSMNAQIHEVGVFLGGSNYIGDVGPTDYIAPNEPAIGILYKWNRSPRHAWRFSYMQSEIASNDKDAKTPGRYQRGYSFKNSIKEVSLGLEFNFFDFNLHDIKRKITPYVYSGVSYFAYDELFVVGGETKVDYTHGALAIPMTVGLKSNIMPHLILGVEVGARYTFTDNLDGNNPKNENFETLKFGNINNNDWYVFTGITLMYTFGNKPCYCVE